MVSVFVVGSEEAGLPRAVADLEAVGVAVLGRADPRVMVEAVIRAAPDCVVCIEPHPEDALFEGIEALNRSAPRPTVVFTTDPDADKIERAAQAGIHAYEVNGYALGRLRPVIQTAQARFRHIEALRTELADVHHRFSERKLVDQAKAILMRLRNWPEDEAYAALRNTAMKNNKRMGQVSRQIIEAARAGDAVNRAGRLRMLSQRIVGLYALMVGEPEEPAGAVPFTESLGLIDAHLAALGRSLSKATYGDLLASVAAPAAALRAEIVPPFSRDRLPAIDALAEQVLVEAEQLTTTLESFGIQAALRVINVSGRQRMLGQRFVKQAILGALLDGSAGRASRERLGRTAAEYRAAMVYLDAVPLRTPAITALVAAAHDQWSALEKAAERAGQAGGRHAVHRAGEAVLQGFEDLTAHYERSLALLLQT